MSLGRGGTDGGEGEGGEGEICPMCENKGHRPLRGRCPKTTKMIFFGSNFLSATEYHSEADYNSRRVGVVVVVVVVVVHTFKNGLTFERLDRFASYLEDRKK